LDDHSGDVRQYVADDNEAGFLKSGHGRAALEETENGAK